MAERAAQIIDADLELMVTGVVLAETAYVLTSVYEVPRQAVVEHLIRVIRKRNIALFGVDKNAAIHSLMLCRASGRVSFADAMIWAAARSAGAATVYSFDRRFPNEGLDVRQSP